jgi:hypothetical protein
MSDEIYDVHDQLIETIYQLAPSWLVVLGFGILFQSLQDLFCRFKASDGFFMTFLRTHYEFLALKKFPFHSFELFLHKSIVNMKFI